MEFPLLVRRHLYIESGPCSGGRVIDLFMNCSDGIPLIDLSMSLLLYGNQHCSIAPATQNNSCRRYSGTSWSWVVLLYENQYCCIVPALHNDLRWPTVEPPCKNYKTFKSHDIRICSILSVYLCTLIIEFKSYIKIAYTKTTYVVTQPFCFSKAFPLNRFESCSMDG